MTSNCMEKEPKHKAPELLSIDQRKILTSTQRSPGICVFRI